MSDDDLGDSLDAVDALIRKHDDFAKSFAAQEDKIKDIDETATKLIENEHYAAPDIDERRNEVSWSWYIRLSIHYLLYMY